MTNIRTIAIGADHAGFQLKKLITQQLNEKGYTVLDQGTFSEDSMDYPDVAHPVAELVESGKAHTGILICGSANGVAIAANKHQGIRAAIAWLPELAALARQHNDANILAIPARFVSEDIATEMIDTFLETAFEGGRHQKRVDKIAHC